MQSDTLEVTMDSSSQSSNPPQTQVPPDTSRPQLPPELTDYILDYCHNDKNTLWTCSLVSRSFNTACRYHLFQKGIDISNTPEVRKDRAGEAVKVDEGNEDVGGSTGNAGSKGNEAHTFHDIGTKNEVATSFDYINCASSAASFVRTVLVPSSTVAASLQELSLIIRSSWSYSRSTAIPANAWLDELLALLPATKTVSSPSYDNASSPAARPSSPTQNHLRLRTLRIFRHGVDLSPFARRALHQNFANTVTTLAFFETTLQKRSLKSDMEWVCGFPKLEDILFYGHHHGETLVSENRDTGNSTTNDNLVIAAPSLWGKAHPESRFDLDEALDAQGAIVIRLPHTVRRLRLDLPGSALEEIMRWLLAHGSGSETRKMSSTNDKDDEGEKHFGIPRISALHLFRVMHTDLPALREYLRVCQNSLEDLMMFLYQSKTNLDDLDLSSHTAMRSVFLASNGSKPMKVLYEILLTLSMSPSFSQMRKIYLHIHQWQLVSTEDAWDSLDGLLQTLLESSSSSGKLQIFAVVDGRNCHPAYEVEEEVEATLGRLRKRLPLSTSKFMTQPISPYAQVKGAGNGARFTMINNKAKEVLDYVDEVYGRMRHGLLDVLTSLI
ncbi:hypothetical protein F5878DRAFT_661848 [Lentinula raphanica]|uniref:F-box domain-containing protein n=1 Tax=Lentinula raphanica TaxID=153919 RepID=A0AA38P7I0_9AGAR|nr:hypothetical protein F5878DRAFT_661848 [Lentinula raphanica]